MFDGKGRPVGIVDCDDIRGEAGDIAVEEDSRNIIFQQGGEVIGDTGGRSDDEGVDMGITIDFYEVSRNGAVVSGAGIEDPIAMPVGLFFDDPGYGGEKRVGDVFDQHGNDMAGQTHIFQKMLNGLSKFVNLVQNRNSLLYVAPIPADLFVHTLALINCIVNI